MEAIKSVMANVIENYLNKGKHTETFKKVTTALNPSDLFQVRRAAHWQPEKGAGAGQVHWQAREQDKFDSD